MSHSFEVGIEHVNIPRSSPMEGDHTPTIIQLILSTDLAVIQLKDSHLILHISQHQVSAMSMFLLP